MSAPVPLWRVDPLDPRAPPQAIWDQLSERERAEIVDALPSDFPVSESSPPEGDRHYEAYTTARETLSRWFRDRGRRVYVSGNLPVYYPGESMFSPDVIAVMDVEPHPRESWIVSREGGRGLDFVAPGHSRLPRVSASLDSMQNANSFSLTQVEEPNAEGGRWVDLGARDR